MNEALRIITYKLNEYNELLNTLDTQIELIKETEAKIRELETAKDILLNVDNDLHGLADNKLSAQILMIDRDHKLLLLKRAKPTFKNLPYMTIRFGTNNETGKYFFTSGDYDLSLKQAFDSMTRRAN